MGARVTACVIGFCLFHETCDFRGMDFSKLSRSEVWRLLVVVISPQYTNVCTCVVIWCTIDHFYCIKLPKGAHCCYGDKQERPTLHHAERRRVQKTFGSPDEKDGAKRIWGCDAG